MTEINVRGSVGRPKLGEEVFPLPDKITIDCSMGHKVAEAFFYIETQFYWYIELLQTFGGFLYYNQLLELSPKSRTATKNDIDKMQEFAIIKEGQTTAKGKYLMVATNGVRYISGNKKSTKIRNPEEMRLRRNAYLMDYFSKHYDSSTIDNSYIFNLEKMAMEVFKNNDYQKYRTIVEQSDEKISNYKKEISRFNRAIKAIEDKIKAKEDAGEFVSQWHVSKKELNQAYEDRKKIIDSIEYVKNENMHYKYFIKKMDKQYALALKGQDDFTKLRKSRIYLDSFNAETKTLRFIILDIQRNKSWLFNSYMKIENILRALQKDLRNGKWKNHIKDVEVFNFEVIILCDDQGRLASFKVDSQQAIKEFTKNKIELLKGITVLNEDGEIIETGLESEPLYHKTRGALMKKTSFFLKDIKLEYFNIQRFRRRSANELETYMKEQDYNSRMDIIAKFKAIREQNQDDDLI